MSDAGSSSQHVGGVARHHRKFTHYVVSHCELVPEVALATLQHCQQQLAATRSSAPIIEWAVVAREVHSTTGDHHLHVAVVWRDGALAVDTYVAALRAALLRELVAAAAGAASAAAPPSAIQSRKHVSAVTLLRYVMKLADQPTGEAMTPALWAQVRHWKPASEVACAGLTYDDLIAALHAAASTATHRHSSVTGDYPDSASQSSPSSFRQPSITAALLRAALTPPTNNDEFIIPVLSQPGTPEAIAPPPPPPPPQEPLPQTSTTPTATRISLVDARKTSLTAQRRRGIPRRRRPPVASATAATATTHQSTLSSFINSHRHQNRNDNNEDDSVSTSTGDSSAASATAQPTTTTTAKRRRRSTNAPNTSAPPTTRPEPPLLRYMRHYQQTGDFPSDPTAQLLLSMQATKALAAAAFLDRSRKPSSIVAIIRSHAIDSQPYDFNADFHANAPLWDAFLEIGRQLNARAPRQPHVFMHGPPRTGKTALINGISSIPGINIGYFNHGNFPFSSYLPSHHLFIIEEARKIPADQFNAFTGGAADGRIRAPANAFPQGIRQIHTPPTIIISNERWPFDSGIDEAVGEATESRLQRFHLTERFSFENGFSWDSHRLCATWLAQNVVVVAPPSPPLLPQTDSLPPPPPPPPPSIITPEEFIAFLDSVNNTNPPSKPLTTSTTVSNPNPDNISSPTPASSSPTHVADADNDSLEEFFL